MRRRRLLIVGVGVAAVLLLLLLWIRAPRQPDPDIRTGGGWPESVPADGPPGVASSPRVMPPRAGSEAPALGDLPGSLRGTEVDGGLTVDADGHFVPDREALALFDYFLSTRGEATEAEITARIQAEIETRLDPPADRQALAFLDRYLAYQEAGRALTADARLADAGDLERRFQWVRELRREHFGAETAEALFGDEEAMVAASLEERRILSDPDLTPEERADALARVAEELPDSIRESRRRARLPAEAWQEERAMRAEGASDAEIQAYREATFGPEAAARLAALDRRRAEAHAAEAADE